FTNGCFDIIHRGHVEYLSQAKELGDFLIIGLNTDESVRRLKGEGRPLVEEQSRAVLLAALEMVDAVILFDDDTPLNLIKNILPDILVKGADYTIEQIVGAKEVLGNGGLVKTIDFVEGFSTTDIIRKIGKIKKI
ncbi:MAG: D-glycero-beta-D-manno-heptose 1-phosphate adenylyltransferase, partial [Calditrichia bacterium]|nr:D-glycero-beta-D-manno-heptose 1-phosphate adenylyltransferase [Calditrichia bacterium]